MTQTVVVSQPVTFSCEATGIPTPVIYWSIDDTRLMNNSNILIESTSGDTEYITSSYLTIREVALDVNGATITCMAENIIGSVSATAPLAVLSKEESIT